MLKNKWLDVLLMRSTNRQRGFSLIEVLISMAISSVVCIAVMSTIPILFKQVSEAYFQYQLDREARQILLNMEKDFRRIGYCSSPNCGSGTAITIASMTSGRSLNSCIIFAYDQDLSGQWVNSVNAKKADTDFFGYRLNANKLESNRNVTHCNGTRWQSLFDVNLVKVKHLNFTYEPEGSWLTVMMAVESNTLKNKVLSYKFSVLLRNLL